MHANERAEVDICCSRKRRRMRVWYYLKCSAGDKIKFTISIMDWVQSRRSLRTEMVRTEDVLSC